MPIGEVVMRNVGTFPSPHTSINCTMKPIVFNTKEVRAILDGRKTQTRRPLKARASVQPYNPGDIMWVREAWQEDWAHNRFFYRADADDDGVSVPYLMNGAGGVANSAGVGTAIIAKWRPSIHMPRKAARLFLYVTDVRVERLQDISWDDAVAESFPGYRPLQIEPTHDFRQAWDQAYNKKSMGWNQNPWVWVIEFEKISEP